MKPKDALKTKRRIRMEAAAEVEALAPKNPKPVAKKVPKKVSKEY